MDAASREKFHKILDAWGLNGEQREQLLNQPDAASVITINDALFRIFELDQVRASAFVKKPNRGFKGRSALDLMLRGDIERVLKYVMYHLYNGGY